MSSITHKSPSPLLHGKCGWVFVREHVPWDCRTVNFTVPTTSYTSHSTARCPCQTKRVHAPLVTHNADCEQRRKWFKFICARASCICASGNTLKSEDNLVWCRRRRQHQSPTSTVTVNRIDRWRGIKRFQTITFLLRCCIKFRFDAINDKWLPPPSPSTEPHNVSHRKNYLFHFGVSFFFRSPFSPSKCAFVFFSPSDRLQWRRTKLRYRWVKESKQCKKRKSFLFFRM